MLTQNSRHRVFLMLVVLGQISFVPIVIFGLTRFVETGWTDGSPYLLFRWDLIPWICSTGIFYGMISLILAIVMSGWMPSAIAMRGGWLAFLGLWGRSRDPRKIDRASTSLSSSPYGLLATVTSRQRDRFDLIFVHGGQLLNHQTWKENGIMNDLQVTATLATNSSDPGADQRFRAPVQTGATGMTTLRKA